MGVALHHSKGRGSPYQMAKFNVDDGGAGHPYHFHVHKNGLKWEVYQTRFLSEVSYHAGSKRYGDHNRTRWGIVVTGNYDLDPWPEGVGPLVYDLCALLLLFQGIRSASETASVKVADGYLEAPRVAGHRELPWGSKKVDRLGNVTKSCPGLDISMPNVRAAVQNQLTKRDHYEPADAHLELIRAGVWVREA